MKTAYIIQVLKNGDCNEDNRFQYASKEAMDLDFAKLQAKYKTTQVETEKMDVEGLDYTLWKAVNGKSKHGDDVEVCASEAVKTSSYIMA